MNYQPLLALFDVLPTIILLLKSLLADLPLSSVPSGRNIMANVALACPAKQTTTQERIVKFGSLSATRSFIVNVSTCSIVCRRREDTTNGPTGDPCMVRLP